MTVFHLLISLAGLPAGSVPATGLSVVGVQLLVCVAHSKLYCGALHGRPLPPVEAPDPLGKHPSTDGDRCHGIHECCPERAPSLFCGRSRRRVPRMQSSSGVREVSTVVAEIEAPIIIVEHVPVQICLRRRP